MNSSIKNEPGNSKLDSRTRNAVRASVVLLAVFLGTFGLLLDLIRTYPAQQVYILSILTGVSALLNIFAFGFSLRKQVENSAFLMIGSILILFPFAALFLSGIGLVLGAGGLIGIFMIANLTLVQPELTRANIIGIILGVAVILLDTLLPYQQLEIPVLSIYFQVVVVAGIGIFAYYISKEFSNYALRTKLIIFFIIISVFSVGAIAFVINNLVRTEITQQAGQTQQSLAVRIAYETGKTLESQIGHLQAAAPQFEEITASTNQKYTGTNDQIITQILSLDKRWVDAADSDSLITSVLNNPTAAQLKEFQNSFPSHVEVFVTDKYGANIASSDRTSDYYQADEEWWQSAYNFGDGKVYIAQPQFDESSQTYSVNLAVPIFGKDGKVSGILRSTLDATAIIENIQQGTIGGTTKIDLRTSNDALLSKEPIAQNELFGLSTVLEKYGEITYQGKASLVSQEPVAVSLNSSSSQAISDLGWSIIVHQDLVEALQPIRQQTTTLTFLALIITVLVGLLGFFASQRLVAPILTLTEVTRKISEGNRTIRAQIPAQDEIGALANSFNRMTDELNQTLGSLEQRVADRTAELENARIQSEKRSRELQAIGEISSIITSEQRTENLLPLITRLVSERFDFYHVGIFLLDETKQFAHLKAANSPGGQRMLTRGHRLEVGATGIVGNVTSTGRPRIALDVGTDTVFFNNPDLPETHSEMALPLIAKGVLIGALDVQSTKPNAFSESDVKVLSILADQVATAIENTRLFEQTREALDEVQTVYGQFLKEQWTLFAQQEEQVGYLQEVTGGKKLTKSIDSDEIKQVMNQGRIMVTKNGNGNHVQPQLIVPIKLRSQVIGIININSPASQKEWNQDEINLTEAVSERMALALENARLLEDSQTRAAKEQVIGEVTARIGASINMQSVLQTAVEELGRALPGSEVVIQIQSQDQEE